MSPLSDSVTSSETALPGITFRDSPSRPFSFLSRRAIRRNKLFHSEPDAESRDQNAAHRREHPSEHWPRQQPAKDAPSLTSLHALSQFLKEDSGRVHFLELAKQRNGAAQRLGLLSADRAFREMILDGLPLSSSQFVCHERV
jgi:hypothetical protein